MEHKDLIRRARETALARARTRGPEREALDELITEMADALQRYDDLLVDRNVQYAVWDLRKGRKGGVVTPPLHSQYLAFTACDALAREDSWVVQRNSYGTKWVPAEGVQSDE